MMKANKNTSFDRKNFTEIYEMVMENGNTALKPLSPLPSRPPLYLVPKPAAEEESIDAKQHTGLGKYILGFVGLFCLFSILSGNGALVGDLLGAGAVAYFATRSLMEE